METAVQQITFPRQSLDSEATSVSQDINVLALVKGAERYVFLYNETHKAETLRVLGRYASNPELSFTWYDAAVLSQKIRQESQQKLREKQQKQRVSNRVVNEWDKVV
ncbi:MAG: hypothetical protein LBN39_03530 [Planctomycetaceae bacterium]|jgi:hypothetical protein|nr:hypothetical protein [Planctomycetaceae bacterium]